MDRRGYKSKDSVNRNGYGIEDHQMLEACLYPPENQEICLEEQNPILNTKFREMVKRWRVKFLVKREDSTWCICIRVENPAQFSKIPEEAESYFTASCFSTATSRLQHTNKDGDNLPTPVTDSSH
ncbi:hypothetical protein llap_1690 [Limosa lapponica baueri]|uniref:Uncharacterized protein n=1 Tax=Limosa lapponica baueri TaxID=1758121 RepID=A0A2I0UPL7_LIMLA|nr:hypothetical protein llap_1690 [Limosa lapponica baueri]